VVRRSGKGKRKKHALSHKPNFGGKEASEVANAGKRKQLVVQCTDKRLTEIFSKYTYQSPYFSSIRLEFERGRTDRSPKEQAK